MRPMVELYSCYINKQYVCSMSCRGTKKFTSVINTAIWI